MSDETDDRVERSTVILIVCAVVAAVLFLLHLLGFLDFGDDWESPPVGEFTAIYLEPGQQHRMSIQPSELHARCEDGFLVIASAADPFMRGLLVDYRNRGVRCAAPMTEPPPVVTPPVD